MTNKSFRATGLSPIKLSPLDRLSARDSIAALAVWGLR
jgi:hypothetical protein